MLGLVNNSFTKGHGVRLREGNNKTFPALSVLRLHVRRGTIVLLIVLCVATWFTTNARAQESLPDKSVSGVTATLGYLGSLASEQKATVSN
ncbi:hypothetical protein N9L06_04760, partial [Mariniblastus sp.]|nr:hypothetical protein [Mariniblastus sp.]